MHCVTVDELVRQITFRLFHHLFLYLSSKKSCQSAKLAQFLNHLLYIVNTDHDSKKIMSTYISSLPSSSLFDDMTCDNR